MKTRLEHDSLGEIQVPIDAYYGVQTLRAIENFNEISGYELDFTSFTGQVKENNTENSFFIEKGRNKVFVKLIDENIELLLEKYSKFDNLLLTFDNSCDIFPA